MEGVRTHDEFFKGLSEAEWDKAEAIESEICALLSEGLTEHTAVKFVRTVMKVQAAIPDATVEGIFEIALIGGLAYIGDDATIAQMRGESSKLKKTTRKPKAKLSGAGL